MIDRVSTVAAWHVETALRDLFEENLEVLGHVLFVVLVIASAIFAGAIPERSGE